MKDAYYFSHDCGARNDPKMLQLRIKMGWEGYGLFFAFIEILREQQEYRYPSKAKATLELGLSIDKAKLDLFFGAAIDSGLLVDDGEFIFSESLNRRMEKKEELRNKLSEAGRKGGLAKAKLWQGGKPPSTIKGKERKEKERKRKEISKAAFPLFWELYPKKLGKKKAEEKWNQINPEQDLIDNIMSGLKEQKNSSNWKDSGGKFIPNPATWLNQERWEDDFGANYISGSDTGGHPEGITGVIL